MRFFHYGCGWLDVGDPLKEVRSLRQCAIHRRVDVVVDGARNSQLSQWLDVYGSLWNRSESGSQVPVSNLLGSEHCLQFVFRLRSCAPGFEYVGERRQAMLQPLFGRLLDCLRVRKIRPGSLFLA